MSNPCELEPALEGLLELEGVPLTFCRRPTVIPVPPLIIPPIIIPGVTVDPGDFCTTFTADVRFVVKGKPPDVVTFVPPAVVPNDGPDCGFDITGSVTIDACEKFETVVNVTLGEGYGGYVPPDIIATDVYVGPRVCGTDLDFNIEIAACKSFGVTPINSVVSLGFTFPTFTAANAGTDYPDKCSWDVGLTFGMDWDAMYVPIGDGCFEVSETRTVNEKVCMTFNSGEFQLTGNISNLVRLTDLYPKNMCLCTIEIIDVIEEDVSGDFLPDVRRYMFGTACSALTEEQLEQHMKEELTMEPGQYVVACADPQTCACQSEYLGEFPQPGNLCGCPTEAQQLAADTLTGVGFTLFGITATPYNCWTSGQDYALPPPPPPP